MAGIGNDNTMHTTDKQWQVKNTCSWLYRTGLAEFSIND